MRPGARHSLLLLGFGEAALMDLQCIRVGELWRGCSDEKIDGNCDDDPFQCAAVIASTYCARPLTAKS